MVAFLTALVITVAITVSIMQYGKRRPVGTPLTWGEAMFGAAVVFFAIFLIYGVVPRQWLEFARTDPGSRKGSSFLGPFSILDKGVPFAASCQPIRGMSGAGTS